MPSQKGETSSRPRRATREFINLSPGVTRPEASNSAIADGMKATIPTNDLLTQAAAVIAGFCLRRSSFVPSHTAKWRIMAMTSGACPCEST
jgi:hypothetical protein